MNERLKELAEEAFTYAYTTCKENGVSETNSIWLSIALGKLSELVIKECAYVADAKEQGDEKYDKEISVSWYIKKHFGIE